VSYAGQQPSPFAVLRRREFRLLFSAHFITSSGSGLSMLASSILVFSLTNSATSVGLMLMASALPSLVFGLWAGVFVDRYDRKKVMVVTQLIRALLVSLIPWVIPFGVNWIYLLVMLSSSVGSFFGPARESVLPDTAPDQELSAANALMTISESMALTLGFIGAGLLANQELLPWAFWLDAASYLGAALCISLMAIKPTSVHEQTSVRVVLQNLYTGLQYVRRTAPLRSLFIIFIPVSLLFGFQDTLLLPFSTQGLGATKFEYSLLEGLFTIGFLVGGLAMVMLTDRIHAGQWISTSLMLMGVIGIGFAYAPSVPIAIGLSGLLGLANVPSYIGRVLTLQRHTPREMRGRVSSTFTVVKNALVMLGMAGAGLADRFDIRILLLGYAIALIGCGLLALRMPGIGQPSLEWRRLFQMLRTAPQSTRLGLGQAASPADIEQLVQLVPALRSLSSAELRELTVSARIQHVDIGKVILGEGEASNAIYFLLSGRTIATATEGEMPGSDDILETHMAGSFFGEIAAITGTPRTATVVAEQPTTLVQIPATTVRLLMNHAQISTLLLGTLAERILRLRMSDSSRFGGMESMTIRPLQTPVPTLISQG
jgi:MFS family permease